MGSSIGAADVVISTGGSRAQFRIQSRPGYQVSIADGNGPIIIGGNGVSNGPIPYFRSGGRYCDPISCSHLHGLFGLFFEDSLPGVSNIGKILQAGDV